jgi:hypothetical protein
MIGCLWNPRGFGKPGRSKSIADVLLNNKLDFVGFQETKKELVSKSFLKTISSPFEFDWHYLPAKGTPGGILVGFKSDLFEVISYSLHDYYCVSTVVKNLCDGFTWQLIVIYGSAYAEHKVDFISELHLVMEQCALPSLIGGVLWYLLEGGRKRAGRGPCPRPVARGKGFPS